MTNKTGEAGTTRAWVTKSAAKAMQWKRAMANHVATHGFVQYGDSLLIGSGTTPMCFTQALIDYQIERRESLDLAIVTSNLQVLYSIRDAQRSNAAIFGGTQVLMTGGRLNQSLDSMVGDYAARAVLDPSFNTRVVCFGAAGLSFIGGLSMTFHFEEEFATQRAFATRPTTDRILLCDHTKLGRASFFESNLSIDGLMRDATTCYVITSYDPGDPAVVSAVAAEEVALVGELKKLVDRDDLLEKDFVFRLIRGDGTVDREVRLADIRQGTVGHRVEVIPRSRSK